MDEMRTAPTESSPRRNQEVTMTTIAPAPHAITFLGYKPASGPGALDGHEFRCSCGERQGTSLSINEARRMAWAHVDYFERNGSKRRPK